MTYPPGVIEKFVSDANIGVVGSGKAKKTKGAVKSALCVACIKCCVVANLEAWRDRGMEAFDAKSRLGKSSGVRECLSLLGPQRHQGGLRREFVFEEMRDLE